MFTVGCLLVRPRPSPPGWQSALCTCSRLWVFCLLDGLNWELPGVPTRRVTFVIYPALQPAVWAAGVCPVKDYVSVRQHLQFTQVNPLLIVKEGWRWAEEVAGWRWQSATCSEVTQQSLSERRHTHTLWVELSLSVWSTAGMKFNVRF